MKKLLLIRHAHRDNADPMEDNGLSDKGRKQADRLKEHLKDFHKAFPITRMLSSSKKRCLETLEPISKQLGISVDQERDLYEREALESLKDFLHRIERFLDRWKLEGEGVWVACSHGDWLPIAIQHLTGARVETKKGSMAEISYDAGEIYLTSLIQRF